MSPLALSCPPVHFTESLISQIQSQLEVEGFFLFQADNTDRSTLLELGDQFGDRLGYELADEDGIYEISPSISRQNVPMIDTTQHLGLGCQYHGPHPDGSYLHGIVKTKDGSFILVRLPKIVLMQMVQPALQGGVSILVDGQRIFEGALLHDPKIMKALLKPCLVYCRGDFHSSFTAVFNQISPNRWNFCSRFDFTTFVAEEAYDSLKEFHCKYVSNPKYQIRLSLESGEILGVDNLRFSHGRDAFEDDPRQKRHLRRLWIADDKVVLFNINPTEQKRELGVLSRYEKYPRLERRTEKPAIPVATGIRLSPECQALAERLLESEN